MSKNSPYYYVYKPDIGGKHSESLPEKIVMAECGWYGEYRFYGVEPTFYEYVPKELLTKAENENAKLRELVRELGIEVDE